MGASAPSFRMLAFVGGSLALVWSGSSPHAQAPQPASKPAPSTASQRALLDKYCVTCHSEKMRATGSVPVSFEGADLNNVADHAELWETTVRKLRAGLMPPDGMPRPDKDSYEGLRVWLENELDRGATASPNPGKPTIRRLTRGEYTNAIRDIFALEVEPTSLMFPEDEKDEFEDE